MTSPAARLRQVFLALLLLACAAGAQTAGSSLLKSIQVSGTVDGYASLNFNHVNQNQLYTFPSQSQNISFNLAELDLAIPAASKAGAWGFTASLIAGPTADVVQSGDLTANDGSMRNVLQAYGSYMLTPAVKLDFGRFVTPLGAEVIEAKSNWNYSRSILFGYAIPFDHTGVRATAAVTSKLSVYGMVVNGWNNVGDNNSSKTLGAGFSYAPSGAWSIAENIISGPETTGDNHDLRTVTDTVVIVNPASNLSLMANYDFGEDKTGGTNRWQGVAGYIHYAFNTHLSITPRLEWYSDPQGFTTGTAQQLEEGTLTVEYKAGDHAATRAEYRIDHSNHAFFTTNGAASKNQSTAMLALLMMF